jgi:hypothetical protein
MASTVADVGIIAGAATDAVTGASGQNETLADGAFSSEVPK